MTFLKLKDTIVSAAPLGYARDYEAQIAALANLLSWHQPRAEDFTSADSSGTERASSWAPRVGVGAFAQGTTGRQPALVDNYLNGHPALYFDSARADKMAWGGTFPTGGSAQWTKIALVRPAASMAGSNGNLLSSRTVAANSHLLFFNTSSQLQNSVSDGGDLPSATSTAMAYDAWHLVVGGYDAATDTVSVQVDGGAKVTDAGTGEAAESTLILGANTAAATGGTLLGHVMDIWLFDDDLPADSGRADDLALIREYCQARYGISV